MSSAALFVPRIREAGFRSYSEYLNSSHWHFIKGVYFSSGRPRRCFSCGDPHFQLHHVSYVRMGHEDLNDVLPLCRACHWTLHCAPERDTPYNIFSIARFFFPNLSRRDRRRKVAQFTNRGLGKKWENFRNSGQLRENSVDTHDFQAIVRIAGGRKNWQPKPNGSSVEAINSVKNLIRKMKKEPRD